jgi:hypothetical protein
MQYTESELIELWNERAAIREYDGGLDRERAEEAAYYDLRRIVGQGVAVPEVVRDAVRKFRK